MRVASFCLFSALLLGCVNDPATGDAGKQTGEEGGPCFSDFTCKQGLLCNLGPNLCVKPGTDGAVIDTGTDGGGMSDAPGADGDADGGVVPCMGSVAGTAAWWPGDGTLTEQIGMKNFTWSSASYAPAKVAQGFSFSNPTIFPTSTVSGFTGANGFTIEMWVDPSTAASAPGQTVLACENSFELTWVNGTMSFTIGGCTSGVINVPKMQQSHIAFVLGGALLSPYLNGSAAGQTATACNLGAVTPCSSPFRLASKPDGTLGFSGTIDELAIYGKSLTGSEIGNIYSISMSGVPVCRTQ